MKILNNFFAFGAIERIFNMIYFNFSCMFFFSFLTAHFQYIFHLFFYFLSHFSVSFQNKYIPLLSDILVHLPLTGLVPHHHPLAKLFPSHFGSLIPSSPAPSQISFLRPLTFWYLFSHHHPFVRWISPTCQFDFFTTTTTTTLFYFDSLTSLLSSLVLSSPLP